MDDEQLRELIAKVIALTERLSQLTPGSREWLDVTKQLRKAKDLLFSEIQLLIQESFQESLNQFLKKKNLFLSYERKQQLEPDLIDLKNETLKMALEEIHKFKQQHASLRNSLKVWIKEILRQKYRLIELLELPNLSLDNNLNDESVETHLNILPDPSTSGGLDEQLMRIAHEDFVCKFWDYIDRDPEGELQNCHPPRFPHCNAQEVAKLLLSSGVYYKPNGINRQKLYKELHQKFSSGSDSTFCDFLNKRCLPLLENIARDFGYK